MRWTRYILAVCFTLLIVLFANGLVFLYESGGEALRLPFFFGDSNRVENEGERIGQLESSIAEEMPVNLMILGLDNEQTRCDVILLFQFNPSAGSLNILSIARDTRVIVNGYHTKINSVFAKGGEELMAEEITEITGLPVHYYVTMDFKGFRKIVDELGGIEFDVPFRMNYDDPTQNLHIHLRKGLQYLDGRKAEQLVRYRKGNYKGQGYTDGDIGRIKMQQDFIKTFISQKLNLRYLSKTDDILDILQEYARTDITLGDILQYAGSISKVNTEQIGCYVLPGESLLMGDAWYYITDYDRTKSLINEHFSTNNTQYNTVNNNSLYSNSPE